MLLKRALVAVSIWVLLAVGAAAAPPHKALIVTGQNGHDWKGTTPVLKKLLEDTGLFTVDVAASPAKGQDMSGFKPNFAAYNLVVSNYQGDAWPEETRKAFVESVQNGGGVVIYHFACAAFADWKEYNEIMGLGGWGPKEKQAPCCGWRREDRPGHHATSTAAVTGPCNLSRSSFASRITRSQRAAREVHAGRDELYGWLRVRQESAVLARLSPPKTRADPMNMNRYCSRRVRQRAGVPDRSGAHRERTEERRLHRSLPTRG